MKKQIIVALVATALLSPAETVSGQDDPNREQQIKAACLYNLAKFIEWPAEAFVDENNSLLVGVLGDASFGRAIAAYDGRQAGGRTIQVRQSDDLDALRSMHILFIGQAHRESVDDVLAAVRDFGVLTVAEFDRFSNAGGMVRLFVRKNKVRFEINRQAGERAGLVFRSQLLKVAERTTS